MDIIYTQLFDNRISHVGLLTHFTYTHTHTLTTETYTDLKLSLNKACRHFTDVMLVSRRTYVKLEPA